MFLLKREKGIVMFNKKGLGSQEIIQNFFNEYKRKHITSLKGKDEVEIFFYEALKSTNIENLKALKIMGFCKKMGVRIPNYDIINAAIFGHKDYKNYIDILADMGFLEIKKGETCLLTHLYSYAHSKKDVVNYLTEKGYPKTFTDTSYIEDLCAKFKLKEIKEIDEQGFSYNVQRVKQSLNNIKSIFSKNEQEKAIELLNYFYNPENLTESQKDSVSEICYSWLINTAMSADNIKKIVNLYNINDIKERFIRENSLNKPGLNLYSLFSSSKFDKLDLLKEYNCDTKKIAQKFLETEVPVMGSSDKNTQLFIKHGGDFDKVIQNSNVLYHAIMKEDYVKIKYLKKYSKNFQDEVNKGEIFYYYMAFILNNGESVFSDENKRVLNGKMVYIAYMFASKNTVNIAFERFIGKEREAMSLLSILMATQNMHLLSVLDKHNMDLDKALVNTLCFSLKSELCLSTEYKQSLIDGITFIYEQKSKDPSEIVDFIENYNHVYSEGDIMGMVSSVIEKEKLKTFSLTLSVLSSTPKNRI